MRLHTILSKCSSLQGLLRLAVFGLVAASCTGCNALLVQRQVRYTVAASVPLEVSTDNVVVGVTNEPIQTPGLSTSSELKIQLRAFGQPLDTITYRRSKHLLIRGRLPAILAVGLAGPFLVPKYAQEIGGTALLVGFATWYSGQTEAKNWVMYNNKRIKYTMDKQATIRYDRLARSARVQDSLDALNSVVSALVTVDYLPTSLRSTRGLTDIALNAGQSYSRVGGKENPPPAPQQLTVKTSNATSQGANSALKPAAVPAAQPTSSGASAGLGKVALKNSGPLPIRVYLSVEQSYVVWSGATIEVEAPKDATIYLAKEKRPLVLQSVGTVPSSRTKPLELDVFELENRLRNE